MQTLKEYIQEAQDYVYAVIDKDLDNAIMSVWDSAEDANKEIDDRKQENPDIKLQAKRMQRSEVEQKK